MVKAFAPATIANIGPGFDMYGVALKGLGDVVEAKKGYEKGVTLVSISCYDDEVREKLPFGNGNVAEAVGQKVLDSSGEKLGIRLKLYKRMPMESGCGGSAASGVSAAWATNAMLENPMQKSDFRLLEAVVYGEAVATKKPVGHPDNVLPSLLGGFVFIHDFPRYERVEIPDSIYFVVVTPDFKVNTGVAREKLKDVPYDLGGLVKLASRFVKSKGLINTENEIYSVLKEGGKDLVVAAYIMGSRKVYDALARGDAKSLGEGVMMDSIVTPVRARFITGYDKVGEAFMGAGAHGFCISGSGPSMFAVASSENRGIEIAEAGVKAFEREGIPSKAIVSTVNNQGAYLF